MIRKCEPISVLVVAAAAVLVGVPSGCKSATEKQREEARESADSFRDALQPMPARIDATMNALMQATSGIDADRDTRYQQFVYKFRSLEKDSRRVAKESEQARSESDKYFQAWARDAVKADPAKRQKMEAATQGRGTNYETAKSYLDSGRDRYRALMTDLNDIKRTLDANLSAATSNEVQTKVSTATVKSVELKNYIARLSEQIDAMLATK